LGLGLGADAMLAESSPAPNGNVPITLGPHERLITILGTNDIHGGIEPGKTKNGSAIGGMSFWSGVARSIRHGIRNRFGQDKAGVVVVDAGDQFQGTLISNHDEGLLMFATMNEMAERDGAGNVIEPGYDAVITGNHDYDFGPVGWLDDQVTPQTSDQNPRGALERLVSMADFPVISASTFLRDSIVDASGNPVDASNALCRAAKGKGQIDWNQSKLPGYVKPYLIEEIAGLRVALIGIDNDETPVTTTPANVSDLCFDEEAEAYLRVRRGLEGYADVFVAIIHDGNTDTSASATKFARKVGAASVDAIVSGHTHWVTNTRVDGVPIIQSGSGGLKFGRIDLIYDTQAGKVVTSRTRSFGGIELLHDRCAPSVKEFCSAKGGVVSYEGVPVERNARIDSLIAQARATLKQNLPYGKLGQASGLIKVDRTRESPLADALTDALRAVSGVDVAFMNTGGIRAPIEAGEFDYEALFKVIPFNNHGLVIGPMSADKLVALLQRSITTCGAFGSLMQSGLRVSFTRDCSRTGSSQLDPDAALTRVDTLSGETIFDASRGGMVAPAGRSFEVITLDFLAAGGSGFDGFKGTPVVSDVGIVREALAKYYSQNPVTLTVATDGRWSESRPASKR
jgi:2',3'-cyclic-nucleotide 2'-phosphodiesterase (5'-nucleotidase family)